MKVAAYVTYNDIETIQESIESIESKVDRIIFVDGRFNDFPGEDLFSKDGTYEYLLSLLKKDYNKYMLVQSIEDTEVEKRNIFLNYVNAGDLCLIIDADEVLVGEIPDLDTDIGLIDIFEFNDRRRHRRYNRFFRFREGLHFYGKHYLILDKDNEVFTTLEYEPSKYTCKKIEGFHLLHKGKLRSPQRELDKKKYYKILQQREAKVCLN